VRTVSDSSKRTDNELKDGKWTDVTFGKVMLGYLCQKGGTFCAAPMASALAGLIRSQRLDLDRKTVVGIIGKGPTISILQDVTNAPAMGRLTSASR
jgi:hypothetical protein